MAVNTKLQDKIEKVLVEQQVEKDAEMAEMLAVSPARSSATYQYSRWFGVLLGPIGPNSTHRLTPLAVLATPTASPRLAASRAASRTKLVHEQFMNSSRTRGCS